MGGNDNGLRLIDLRSCEAGERARLLERFDSELFRPTFPDDDLRENVGVWQRLMERDPGAPLPLIAVFLLLDDRDAIAGGIAIEYYRRSDAGLLTYVLVSPAHRRNGAARRLIDAAVGAVTGMAGHLPVIFAETEMMEAGMDDEEVEVTLQRQRTLGRLGAVMADLDYFMPPLEPGRKEKHLHLLALEPTLPPGGALPAAHVAAFLRELAESLDAELEAVPTTRAMMAGLAGRETVRFGPLPACR